MLKALITCTVAAILTAISAQANTIIFTLDQSACTKSCGTAPYGTITLMDNGTGAGAFVSVIETLKAGEEFAGTGTGNSLDFNVSGPVTIGALSLALPSQVRSQPRLSATSSSRSHVRLVRAATQITTRVRCLSLSVPQPG